MAGATGVTLLGEVNTLLPPVDGAEVLEGAGSDGSRQYDYGPGFRWGGIIQFSRASDPFVTLSYQGYHVSVVDGTRSNHVLSVCMSTDACRSGTHWPSARPEVLLRRPTLAGRQSHRRVTAIRVYGVWTSDAMNHNRPRLIRPVILLTIANQRTNDRRPPRRRPPHGQSGSGLSAASAPAARAGCDMPPGWRVHERPRPLLDWVFAPRPSSMWALNWPGPARN
jgi:hypothetical protein